MLCARHDTRAFCHLWELALIPGVFCHFVHVFYWCILIYSDSFDVCVLPSNIHGLQSREKILIHRIKPSSHGSYWTKDSYWLIWSNQLESSGKMLLCHAWHTTLNHNLQNWVCLLKDYSMSCYQFWELVIVSWLLKENVLSFNL
jgi:hypothetical protein